MYRSILVVFSLASFFFSPDANAASARCEGCTNSQFIAKAKQLGLGEHVITSFSTNQLRLYKVFDGAAGEPGVPLTLLVQPVAVSAAIQAEFDDARRFYVATNGTMKAAVTVRGADLGIPDLVSATAYDVMGNYNLRGRLGDRLATGTLPGWANYDRAGEQIVQGIFGFFGAGDASIDITVELADGSTVVYQLDTSSGTGQYQRDRSRTRDGQPIPEANAQEYQGTWRGSFRDMSALANHLGRMGVTISDLNAATSYGYLVCVWDSVNTRLTCRYTRSP